MTLSAFEFVILALAAYRLTRLVTTDVIFEGFRDKIWSKWPPDTKLGYLITCDWCSGLWISGFLVIFWLLLPELAFVVSLVMSISAIVGLISARLG
jgi:hypothetical protein